MKMTLEEAFKKATPIPLIVGHGKGTCFHEGNMDCLVAAGPDDTETTVAEVWPTTPRSQAKIDAALLAHCFNHFQEVVDVLQRASDDDDDWQLAAFNLLKTVNEVKI